MLENVILVILRRKVGYAVYALIFLLCKYSSMKRIVTENIDFQNFFWGWGVSFDPPPSPSTGLIYIYMYIIYGIFILKIISKYLPIG